MVEQAIFDGWRYLSLDSSAVLSKTPREFSILMRANVEKTYDRYEDMAVMAQMNRQGYHARKLSYKDLFKRPTDEDIAKKRSEKLEDKQERIKQWMSRIKQFQDADIGDDHG